MKFKTKLDRDNFILSHIGLTKNMAGKYSKNVAVEYDELCQVGAIGLIRAVDNFNPEIGVKFCTFAYNYIKGEMLSLIKDSSVLKESRSHHDNKIAVYHAMENLEKKNKRVATTSEIAEYTNLEEKEVEQVFISNLNNLSLNAVASEGNDGWGNLLLEEVIADKDVTCISTKISLQDSINKLKNDEKKVIKNIFFNLLTQKELAKEMNTTQSQISRLKEKGLRRMRSDLGGNFYES